MTVAIARQFPSRSQMSRWRACAARLGMACGMLWLAPYAASGHDSPEHVVQALTARMAREGETAELLRRRASEYRSLRRTEAAASDLLRALEIAPNRTDIQIEQIRVQLQGHDPEAARSSAARAMEQASEEYQSTLLALRGEAYAALGQADLALADFDAACRQRSDDVDLFLQRAELLAKLGRHSERLAGLESGYRDTSSIVLHIERIDTLIELGRLKEALEFVETELADCRWRSSWLIRRAQIHLGQQKPDDAETDLQAAIDEINERLNHERPDPMLLADRAIAESLLGRAEDAISDLANARARIIDSAVIRRAEQIVAASARRPVRPTNTPGRLD